MNLTKYIYWHFESVIPKEICEAFINQYKDKKYEDAVVGAGEKDKVQVNNKIRKTEVSFDTIMSPIGCIAQAYINAANHHAGWNYKLDFLENIQIGKYTAKEKSFYDWHMDTAVPNDMEQQRKISIIIMLSDPEKDFEGGKFELKEAASELNDKLLKKQGSILCFPSFMIHKIHPITKGTRYTAVSWMNGPKWT